MRFWILILVQMCDILEVVAFVGASLRENVRYEVAGGVGGSWSF